MPTLEYKSTVDPEVIPNWCQIALDHRLHAGEFGMFETWFTCPSNFSGLVLAYCGKDPIGVATLLSFVYDADDFADANCGVYVKKSYRRLGLATELIQQLRPLSSTPLKGFSGLYNSNTFWIQADADGRDLDGIRRFARAIHSTPHKLGYHNVPKDTNRLAS